jgi:WD40 repeat protein
VFVWNLATRDRFEFRGHEDAVRHVALTGDGRTLITAGVRDVRIWDVQNATQIGFPIPVKPDGSDDVKDFALSPDGGTLAIVRDHRIQFWSLAAAAKR